MFYYVPRIAIANRWYGRSYAAVRQFPIVLS